MMRDVGCKVSSQELKNQEVNSGDATSWRIGPMMPSKNRSPVGEEFAFAIESYIGSPLAIVDYLLVCLARRMKDLIGGKMAPVIGLCQKLFLRLKKV
ncbi:putative hmg-i hmg-y dna-binding conserved site protein [Anopheles sinensis]|uniref:Putative hmg-i hmg-y dna-binding conserved site protein n=1 Tax=Anopheles sinensis TaxID=74873 RepID=A0A084WUL6_ANOSI|nr:putative hmg-i hmg-y dna-binding conserved site protein [Anopheles sinensis]